MPLEKRHVALVHEEIVTKDDLSCHEDPSQLGHQIVLEISLVDKSHAPNHY